VSELSGRVVELESELRRLSGEVSTDQLTLADFDALMEGWQAVTIALNSLSRSMGMKDVYPFVLSQPVRDKLRFVHDVIANSAKPVSREMPAKATLLSAPEPDFGRS